MIRKIAIVGAGFCGLAAAYQLITSNRNFKVTLFDHKGIGGGASGVATGLLHPYPGAAGRRSRCASEALASTIRSLHIVEAATGRSVASYGGILRVAQNEAQRITFLSHAESYGDVLPLDNSLFLLHSGITVHCAHYLQGLWELVEKLGGRLAVQKVESVEALSDYDLIILAAGGGMLSFKESERFRLKRLKGQVLVARKGKEMSPLERSIIGSGYLAIAEDPSLCYIGSTYEKGNFSEEPDVEVAQREILPKLRSYFSEADQLEIIGCRSGVRLARIDDYYPIVERVSDRVWVFTAMGSRGLLYHAFLSEQLKEKIINSINSSC